MKRIFSLGVQEHYPEYLNKKIRIANRTAAILIVFALLFSVQFFLKRPNIVFLPLGALTNFVLVFGLNALGAITLSRIILAAGPMVLINLIHAYLLPAGEQPVVQTFALGMSVLSLPYILFDFRERKVLIATVLFLALQLIFLPQLIDFFEIELKFPFEFSTGNYIKDLVISILVMAGTLFMMVRNGYLFEKEVEKANHENKLQYEEMNQSKQSLEDTLKQIEQTQKEEQKRNWISSGLSEFNNMLRSTDDLSQVYDQVISWVVNYVKANQGSLFVAEGEDDDIQLELKACYAFSRKKFLEKTIQLGQGLVGQCYLEREYIYLTEIPQDYIRITSGLGDANPDSILVMPLIVNEKVEGILELASFRKFEEHEIELLQKAGESIASTIARHRINLRTVKLLEESQLRTQQLSEQEEEMRQNLEEFEALQEEMKRKEQHYQQEIAELRQKLEEKV